MNTRDEVKDLVLIVLQGQAGNDKSEFKEEVDLRSLGFDSLDMVETVMKMEKEFNVAIPDADAEGLFTTGEIVDYLWKTQTKSIDADRETLKGVEKLKKSMAVTPEKRHVEKALMRMEFQKVGDNHMVRDFIKTDVQGGGSLTEVKVIFQIQSDPIGEVGVNGCQAVDMLKYVGHLFESLNEAFPCEENEKTIEHIIYAINQQKIRTADREKRKVEGKNEA